MLSIALAMLAIGLPVTGVTVLVALFQAGHLDDVRLPRLAGWLDVDDAYDVWPAEHEHRPIVALHEEARRFDTYQEHL